METVDFYVLLNLKSDFLGDFGKQIVICCDLQSMQFFEFMIGSFWFRCFLVLQSEFYRETASPVKKLQEQGQGVSEFFSNIVLNANIVVL